MGRGANRNHVLRDVNVVLHAGCVDAREAFLHSGGVQVREVEVDEWIFGAADFHFMHDGPRHHVARRLFRQRMVFLHEAIHLDVPQIGALTAQRFREQKAGRFLHIHRRGMKLNELHVADFRPRVEGHSHAVSRGGFGIGRVAINLSHTSRSQQNR